MKIIFFLLLILNQNQITYADQSDLPTLCHAHFVGDSNRINTCTKIDQLLFKGLAKKEPSAIITPLIINAHPLKIDHKILFIALKDPNYFPALAYCYAVFHHWINQNQLGPDTLGMISSGVSILNENLNDYQKWLTTKPEGKSCRNLVENESLLPVTNLLDSLKGFTAMIILNPFAVIKNNGDDYNKAIEELKLTLNHERIHAYHVLCPSFEKKEREKWLKLSAIEKNQYIQKYPNYNWQDLKTAGREYSAFNLENNLSLLTELTKSCPTIK